MSEEIRAEWFATYHEGDSRIREKRHGLLRLNNTKQRIEFTVQTAEKSPIIIVNYPLIHLQTIEVIEKRQKMKKHLYLKLKLGEPPNEMTPIFSFSLTNIETVKEEILAFQKEVQALSIEKVEDTERDVLEAFSQLLKTPIEQFQQILGGVSSRLRLLTNQQKKVAETILSPLEPRFPYEIREIELNDRKVSFFGTSYSHDTVLLMLSPMGGCIEDYYPMIASLHGKYQLFILGLRGYIEPIGQDTEFKLKNYIQDVKDFIDYIGPEKNIVLCAHSLFSVIVLDEFLDQKDYNIAKIILISGAHRAPNNFRKGVKFVPPTQTWGSIKGQVRKIAPKILYSKNTEKEIIDPFIQHAFNIPNKVYYQIIKDFLPGYDYTKKLRSLSKPLLVIWGNEDQLITKDLKTEMIECTPPNLLTHKELVGGHMILFEKPNKVAHEINNFITSKWSKIKIE